jgi:hypothetical protein
LYLETVFSNLQLFIYTPFQPDSKLTEEQNHYTFDHALTSMRHMYQLRTDQRFSRWSWLTMAYNDWHAFAVVLSNLCEWPFAKNAKLAWRIVEQSAVLRWETATYSQRVHHWRSIMRAIENARQQRRKRTVTSEHASPSAQVTSSGPTQDHLGHTPCDQPPQPQPNFEDVINMKMIENAVMDGHPLLQQESLMGELDSGDLEGATFPISFF